MKLKNVTLVTLARNGRGGLTVVAIQENPEVASREGVALQGPLVRRLETVAEVQARYQLPSKGKAQEFRRANPLLCLAELPGQQPLQAGSAKAA